MWTTDVEQNIVIFQWRADQLFAHTERRANKHRVRLTTEHSNFFVKNGFSSFFCARQTREK